MQRSFAEAIVATIAKKYELMIPKLMRQPSFHCGLTLFR
jgi:hypothetical protein